MKLIAATNNAHKLIEFKRILEPLGFTVLSGAEWAHLEDEFGVDTVRYYFEPINLESNMFNLDMDEVFALLALRES